jgi:hypothetical protein
MWLQWNPEDIRPISRIRKFKHTEPAIDATRGCWSNPGIKRVVVWCRATAEPKRARGAITEWCMIIKLLVNESV